MAFGEQTGSMIGAMARSVSLSCTLSSVSWRVLGTEEQHAHLECNVLSLAITVKPQYQPLALPSLLLKVSLDRLLVLERDPSTI